MDFMPFSQMPIKVNGFLSFNLCNLLLAKKFAYSYRPISLNFGSLANLIVQKNATLLHFYLLMNTPKYMKANFTKKKKVYAASHMINYFIKIDNFKFTMKLY